MDVPLDGMVQGTSSGSSGSALVVPLHPVEISRDLVLIEHLLRHTRAWTRDRDRSGLLSVVDQRQAFTYASVLTLRGEQMMARVNLADRAWRAARTASPSSRRPLRRWSPAARCRS